MARPMLLVSAIAGLAALTALVSSIDAWSEDPSIGAPYEEISSHPICTMAAGLSGKELEFFIALIEADPGATGKYFLARMQWCRQPSAANDQTASAAWQELVRDSPDSEEADLTEKISTITAWIKEAYQAVSVSQEIPATSHRTSD